MITRSFSSQIYLSFQLCRSDLHFESMTRHEPIIESTTRELYSTGVGIYFAIDEHNPHVQSSFSIIRLHNRVDNITGRAESCILRWISRICRCANHMHHNPIDVEIHPCMKRDACSVPHPHIAYRIFHRVTNSLSAHMLLSLVTVTSHESREIPRVYSAVGSGTLESLLYWVMKSRILDKQEYYEMNRRIEWFWFKTVMRSILKWRVRHKCVR